MYPVQVAYYAHKAGLEFIERSPHHLQILRDGKPLIDVWPGTSRFRVSDARTGSKAVRDTIHDLRAVINYLTKGVT